MAFTSRAGAGAVAETGWNPPRIITAAVGAIFTLMGLAGFFVTGFDGFASHAGGDSLLGFHVNPLHNLVHLALGALGLYMAMRTSTARLYGWLLVAGYGLVFLFGLFAVNRPDINLLAINNADNVLHILAVAAGLAIALWPLRRDNSSAIR